MMDDRLSVARPFLSQTGLIFLTIDFIEVSRLRLLCDAVFGANNFLADIAWEKRYTRSNNAKRFYSLKDTLLCYRGSATLDVIRESRSEKSKSNYSNPEKRLRIKNRRLKENASGPWWFRTVTGTTPDGRRTLVIWRKLTGDPEQDNLVLDEWFTKQGYSTRDFEFQLVYVNGDNNLENPKAPDDTWKVRLIEEDFQM